MKLYHGTSANGLEDLKQRGILPRCSVAGRHRPASNQEATYLSSCYAVFYSTLAAKDYEPCCVIEIDAHRLDVDKLAPDEDWILGRFWPNAWSYEAPALRQKAHRRMRECPELWVESLSNLGTVAHFGVIGPEAFTRYAIFSRSVVRECLTRWNISPDADATLLAMSDPELAERITNYIFSGAAPGVTITDFPENTAPLELFPMPPKTKPNVTRAPRTLEQLWALCESVCSLSNSWIHGVDHWRRVERLGLMLAAVAGSDEVVISLFAPLHDCQRWNDADDPLHGQNAAHFARELFGQVEVAQAFDLNEKRADTLYRALELHNRGQTTDDPTIGACWDADRLDLVRLGVKPDAKFLSTSGAKHPNAVEAANTLLSRFYKNTLLD